MLYFFTGNTNSALCGGDAMALMQVSMGSRRHRLACELRYRVFFEPLGKPFMVVKDDRERVSMHAVVEEGGTVLACGRLTMVENVWIVWQLAVENDFRRQGLGSSILLWMMREVLRHGGGRMELDARVYAVGFYRRYGVLPVGRVFTSVRSGLPHIRMALELSAN